MLDVLQAPNIDGARWYHEISDRRSFAVVQGSSPTGDRFSDLVDLVAPTWSSKKSNSLPAEAIATSDEAYLVGGIIRQNQLPRGLPGDTLVDVPFRHKSVFLSERKFYALVRKAGSLRPYSILVTWIYFFNEFCNNADTPSLRRKNWLGKVDEAVEQKLGKGAQSKSETVSKIVGDITPTQLAHMKTIISNLEKSTYSTSFRELGDPSMLPIPTYSEITTSPWILPLWVPSLGRTSTRPSESSQGTSTLSSTTALLSKDTSILYRST